MDHITGADVLQYGALGLCFTMIMAAVWIARFGIKTLSGVLATLGKGLIEFASSNKLLADKLDGLGSRVSHSEDSIGAAKEHMIKHDARAQAIHEKVNEIGVAIVKIDDKVDRLHCVRAKIDEQVNDQLHDG